MKFRIRAFLIHLCISAFIALSSLGLVYYLWYPKVLAEAFDVSYVVIMLLVVDAIIGPLLTFVCAKQGKKTLKIDLLIIATLQIIAYFYGMYHIAEGRPVWLAFNQNRFEAVTPAELHLPKDNNTSYPKYSWLGPTWIAVRQAKNDTEQSDWLMQELEQGISPAARPDLYVPIEQAWEQILAAAQPLSDLSNKNDIQTVQKVLQDYPTANAALMMITNIDDVVVLINREQREIIASVPLKL